MGISERKIREKEQRRKEILDTAERLFFSHGYEDVSMDGIANNVELNKATLYLYFENKEALFAAIVLRGIGILEKKYIECMVAQDVLGKQGRDAQDVLKDFGLTVADYSNISSYWSGKMMSDYTLAMKMSQLDAEYRKKYSEMSGGNVHSDLEF